MLNPILYSDLVTTIKAVWVEQITPQYCQDLADSMPGRIKAVLAAKGGHTK